MHFVPIPTTQEALDKTALHWLPFLARISKRSKEPVETLIDSILHFRVQIGLVWDGKKAHALVGIQYRHLGKDLVGEICWMTGYGMKEWRELLPELEAYLKEHVGCKVIKPIARLGWEPFLREHGYHKTHVMLEKRFS